jgi:hypothetical protein
MTPKARAFGSKHCKILFIAIVEAKMHCNRKQNMMEVKLNGHGEIQGIQGK